MAQRLLFYDRSIGNLGDEFMCERTGPLALINNVDSSLSLTMGKAETSPANTIQ